MTALPRTPRERLRCLAMRVFGSEDPPWWAIPGFPDYYTWRIAANERLTRRRRREIRREVAAWDAPPLISVALAVGDPPPALVRAAIASVRRQAYPRWELCVELGAGAGGGVRRALRRRALLDRRIRVVPATATPLAAALAAARGEFVVVLGDRDELTVNALYEIAKAVRAYPGAGIVYADEDSVDDAGHRREPWFKPDYNYELLLGGDYVNGPGAYRRALLAEVGAPAAALAGAEAYDLALRCVERLAPAQVVHVPRVLYSRRAAPAAPPAADPAATARLRAVQRHLDRTSPGAVAEPHPEAPGRCRVRFPLPAPAPRVSVVVPTRNALPLLRTCLDTLFEKTAYAPYEVVVVDNGSDEPAALAYLDGLARSGRAAVLREKRPFNFSALCNRGAAAATGEFLLLLNNDMEIVEPGWLAELVAVAARPGVGAVGARLWYPDRTLQHAGVVLGLGLGDVAGHVHVGLPAGEPGYFGRAVLLQACAAVTAACLLVRRSLYDEVGGLDERNLAVAYNDVDFCLRLRAAGHRTVFTPHAQLVHHESASRGTDLEPANAARFEAEARYMRERWGELLRHDPAFNVNLSLADAGVEMLDAPRT